MTSVAGLPKITFTQRLKYARLRLEREWRIFSLNRQVLKNADPKIDPQKVAIFNASTRLGGFSQNAAINLLATWGLQ